MADVELNTLGTSVVTALNTVPLIEIDSDVKIYGDFSNPIPSDARIKENVAELGPMLELLERLRVCTYFKTTTKKDEVGFIAQEVEKLFPWLVNTRAVGNIEDFKELLMVGFIPVLAKALQELNAVVKAQATEIEKLKGSPDAA